jgi:hypothetical protein
MSFLSFLKKAGQVLADIASVYAIGEPVFKQVLSTTASPATAASLGAGADKLGLMFQSVLATEGQFAAAFPTGQTGAQKLLAASSLVGPILSTVDVIRGKSIANEAAYTKAIQTITGGIADLMNSLKADSGLPAASASVLAPAEAVSQVVAAVPPKAS